MKRGNGSCIKINEKENLSKEFQRTNKKQTHSVFFFHHKLLSNISLAIKIIKVKKIKKKYYVYSWQI